MPSRPSLERRRALAALMLAAASALSGCGAADAVIASRARTSLIGATDMDLQMCLGLPDQRLAKGKTEILTYFANSPHTSSIGLGDTGFSYGGYCHATFRLDGGRVTEVRYSGETALFGARDGVCASIVRSCMDRPDPAIAASVTAATPAH